MKKTLLFLFLTVFALSFNSCSDDDEDSDDGDNGGNTVKLTAVFQYKKGDEIKPSAGTRMFIFKTVGDSNDWQYNQTDHTFKKADGTIVNPVYTLKASAGGVIEANIEKNTSYIYAYEPGIDPTKYGVDRFDTKNDPVDILRTH
jgi:uncharacterized lipoprotein YehR (DUF1307 family)